MTNEVLRLSLLPIIADDATFNDDNQLQEFQSAAKWYVRLAHKHLTLRAVKHFATRRIELPISADQHTYELDLGINASAIQIRSFFNVTPNGTANRELRAFLDYEDFLRQNPVLEDITEGMPQRFVVLPLERSEGVNPRHQVRIYPNPDANYTLQYRAKLNATALNQASDQVLWPEEYEHALWIFSWAQVERALGEGKEGVLDQLARQAASDVQLVAGVPDDNKKAIRTMGPIGTANRWPPGRYGGWVSSPLD
jgi:hypothetical protein